MRADDVVLLSALIRPGNGELGNGSFVKACLAGEIGKIGKVIPKFASYRARRSSRFFLV